MEEIIIKAMIGFSCGLLMGIVLIVFFMIFLWIIQEF